MQANYAIDFLAFPFAIYWGISLFKRVTRYDIALYHRYIMPFLFWPYALSVQNASG
jgi:hypothetical protein